MMGAMVALIVGLFASAAYAAVIYCNTTTCFGTPNKDTLYDDNLGTSTIYAGDGADVVNGDYWWWDGEDNLYGNGRGDLLDGADFDTSDVLNGGKGIDVCKRDRNINTGSTDDVVNCETVKISGYDPDVCGGP